jgi:hypothetical protein
MAEPRLYPFDLDRLLLQSVPDAAVYGPLTWQRVRNSSPAVCGSRPKTNGEANENNCPRMKRAPSGSHLASN